MHYFDQDERYRQGPTFYARRFEHCRAEGGDAFVLDATPNTLLHPERVYRTYRQAGGAEALSKVKLIVVLRDPVSRELSAYHHKKAEYVLHPQSDAWYGDIVLPDSDAVMPFEEYAERVLAGQLSDRDWKNTGRYIDHLHQWMSYFDRRQLLVLHYAELKVAPRAAQRRIREFLGAQLPGDLMEKSAPEGEDQDRRATPTARKVLDPFFEEKNVELYKFLEERPGPFMEQHPFPNFTSDSLLSSPNVTNSHQIAKKRNTGYNHSVLEFVHIPKAGGSSVEVAGKHFRSLTVGVYLSQVTTHALSLDPQGRWRASLGAFANFRIRRTGEAIAGAASETCSTLPPFVSRTRQSGSAVCRRCRGIVLPPCFEPETCTNLPRRSRSCAIRTRGSFRSFIGSRIWRKGVKTRTPTWVPMP